MPLPSNLLHTSSLSQSCFYKSLFDYDPHSTSATERWRSSPNTYSVFSLLNHNFSFEKAKFLSHYIFICLFCCFFGHVWQYSRLTPGLCTQRLLLVVSGAHLGRCQRSSLGQLLERQTDNLPVLSSLCPIYFNSIFICALGLPLILL